MKKRAHIIILTLGLVVSSGVYVYTYTNNQHTASSITDSRSKKPLQKDVSLIQTADSQATDVTKNLLKYFYSLSGSEDIRILIGQQLGHANEGASTLVDNYSRYFEALQSQTGKLPAFMGIDYGWEKLPADYSDTNKKLTEYWKKGGLVEVSMSPSNPFTGGGLRDFGLGGHRYDEVFTSGTVVNKRWLQDLDKVAAGLQQLQDAGVTVLWRPLHEMNGDFFWWSYGEQGRVSKEEYVKLWTHMFHYFTNEKKLHNLLWVYSPVASMWENGVRDTDFYYPGDAYVDVVGMDYYNDDISQINNHGNYDKLLALGKPLGLAEVGADSRKGFDNRVFFQELKKHYPEITYMMYWTGWTNFGMATKRAIIENENPEALMADPSSFTLDDVHLPKI
jgi:mannan endo-1,4-beta-mannosidase